MTTLSRTTPLGRRPGVLAQKVNPAEQSIVLLNPKSGEYYTLEAVGARVWELCDGKRTLSDIVALVSDEYDATPEVIEGDVTDLLKELVDEELVVPAG